MSGAKSGSYGFAADPLSGGPRELTDISEARSLLHGERGDGERGGGGQGNVINWLHDKTVLVPIRCPSLDPPWLLLKIWGHATWGHGCELARVPVRVRIRSSTASSLASRRIPSPCRYPSGRIIRGKRIPLPRRKSPTTPKFIRDSLYNGMHIFDSIRYYSIETRCTAQLLPSEGYFHLLGGN